MNNLVAPIVGLVIFLIGAVIIPCVLIVRANHKMRR